MPLGPGARLGPYEIVSALGAGGMGEVYRARDPRLGRDVAIKVIPLAFASDPERLARFEQEARAAAALNHPNILAVFDIGQHDGAPYIVSELLEGGTLRERLNGGALPVRRAVEHGVQICHGLAAAHEKGIVHRDLKPENIFITADGRVKILDFGLAKLTQIEPSFAAMSALPTTPAIHAAPQTLAGVVVGTIGYMAPEQVRGLPADHRADIFALGVIFYEMLAGRRAFHGDTAMDTMMAIVKESPPELSSGQRQIPPALGRIVDRCLEKNPAARFQSTRDLAFALESMSSASVATALAPRSVRVGRPRERLGWSVACVIAGIAAGLLGWWLKPTPAQGNSAIARLTVALPAGDQLANRDVPALALSPEGTQLVYAGVRDGKQQLYLRRIDDLESKVIPGTNAALSPFFSPDGQAVGFFAEGKLKTVALASGTVRILCDAPSGHGGTWSSDGTIYFAPVNTSGLWKVPASGGTPAEVTRVDHSKGEVSHRWPQMLPGGKEVLFSVWTGPGPDEKKIVAQVLATGERRVLVEGGDTGRYVSSGHLIYARNDALMSVQMDVARLTVAASAAPALLAEQVYGGGEGAQYTVSNAGEIAYVPGSLRRIDRQLVWVNRDGRVDPVPLPPRPYSNVALSPDGHQVAIQVDENTLNIWIYDFSRGTLRPLNTRASGSSQVPVWTPDGTRIVYRGTRAGFRNLFWNTVDRSSQEERLTTRENTSQTPGAWSSAGRTLVFTEVDEATGDDISLLRLDGSDPKPQSLIASQFSEQNPKLSPDGRWLAYTSDESGRREVYLRPFPLTDRKWQVSADGGDEPVWARDGRELFYTNGVRMMTASVITQPTVSVESPRLLFEGRYVHSQTGSAAYDVSLDGQRFLRVQPVEPDPPNNQINVVINWFDELKRLGPTK
jgi:eukaryotic-like serine/threonine-protein kinase